MSDDVITPRSHNHGMSDLFSTLLNLAAVFLVCMGLCMPGSASGGFLDDLGDALIFSSGDGSVQAELSGNVDVAVHYIDQRPPGLIFNDDRFLVAPRLSLFLDLFLGDLSYGFVKLRADRGFDPGYHPSGEVRIDEWLLRVRPRNTRLSVQLGKFATVSGNWCGEQVRRLSRPWHAAVPTPSD